MKKLGKALTVTAAVAAAAATVGLTYCSSRASTPQLLYGPPPFDQGAFPENPEDDTRDDDGLIPGFSLEDEISSYQTLYGPPPLYGEPDVDILDDADEDEQPGNESSE